MLTILAFDSFRYLLLSAFSCVAPNLYAKKSASSSNNACDSSLPNTDGAEICEVSEHPGCDPLCCSRSTLMCPVMLSW